MPYDIDYFRAIQNTTGVRTRTEAKINDSRINLSRGLEGSINLYPNAKRNGIVQPIILTASETRHKALIEAMPGDEIKIGDLIEVIDHHGETMHWLMMQMVRTNPNQLQGMAWLCNINFAFQTFDSEIHHSWGILDSGVYSTSLSRDDKLTVPDQQYKVYMQLDESTEQIYVDKRLATERAYDQRGDKILMVYKITGRDTVARNYVNGHLLDLYARSDLYDPSRDNYDLMICDYKEPPAKHVSKEMYIVGDETLAANGLESEYAVTVKGITQIPSHVTWEIEAGDKVRSKLSVRVEGKLYLKMPVGLEFVGSELTIRAHDDDGVYDDATMTLKIGGLV